MKGNLFFQMGVGQQQHIEVVPFLNSKLCLNGLFVQTLIR